MFLLQVLHRTSNTDVMVSRAHMFLLRCIVFVYRQRRKMSFQSNQNLQPLIDLLYFLDYFPFNYFVFLEGTRLANFQIGTTNTNPTQTAPAVGNYRPCAVNGGAMEKGECKAIDCHSKGRYLVVQLRGSNYLTLCEVQVYTGTPKTG